MRDGQSRKPLQFDLRTMFVVTAALAAVFGALRWLGVPPQASLLVLGVLAASVIAALGLVVVIAGSGDAASRGNGEAASRGREAPGAPRSTGRDGRSMRRKR